MHLPPGKCRVTVAICRGCFLGHPPVRGLFVKIPEAADVGDFLSSSLAGHLTFK